MSKKTEKLEDLKNLFLYQCADIDTGLCQLPTTYRGGGL